MTFENILLEKKNSIAYVTVNRPKVLNALNMATMEELRAAFHDIKNDDGIRVVILTGSGEKAFVAGADISELAVQDAVMGKKYAHRGQSVLNLIENLGKPVIACINGFALGGGCELALACTMRLASENAKLGQPEVKLGIIPGYGGSQRLPRLVGKGLAMQHILAGEMISAQEAYRIGLVNEVTAAAELIPRAEAIAAKIIANAPLAVQYAMEAVNKGMEMMLAEGLFLEASLFGVCCATEDKKEGTAAFLEKRPAAFKGSKSTVERGYFVSDRSASGFLLIEGQSHHGVTESRRKEKQIENRTSARTKVPALEGGLDATGSGLLLSFPALMRSLLSDFCRVLMTGCCARARKKDIVLVRVPGAFEIPSAARMLAETGKYDAIICIGCLLRGDTAHYDVIVNEVTRGIGQSAQETGVPHAFGVLTCETLEQAIDRAGLKMGNKGFEAALAAVEMANLK